MTDTVDKTLFKDSMGRYKTQSLFLEFQYSPEEAVFTFEGEDRVYEGKKFISLKKRFLEMGDVTEYTFARKWLYDWGHWERLQGNAALSRHFQDWREELEVSIKSEGFLAMVEQAANGNVTAAKWLADKGWTKGSVGRPKKTQTDAEMKAAQKEEDKMWGNIVTRMPTTKRK